MLVQRQITNMHVLILLKHISAEEDKKDEQTIVELECNTIKMLFESRPRTSGMKFGISVGGLYLRDKLTPNSILPVLIAPQNRVPVL